MAGSDFGEKSPVDSADTMRVKNSSKSLSHTLSEINTFLHFTQKFKMMAKNGGKMFFCEKSPVDSADTMGVKNVIEITLLHTVSEINAFLCFTQKFKMAANNGGKTIFVKSRQ